MCSPSYTQFHCLRYVHKIRPVKWIVNILNTDKPEVNYITSHVSHHQFTKQDVTLLYPLRTTNWEKRGRAEDLEDRRIALHDAQRPESTGLSVAGSQPEPASGKQDAAHIAHPKDLSSCAVWPCRLRSIWWYRMRMHQFSQHSVKAPWRLARDGCQFKKCKTCFSQENPRHSSLNPQEIRKNKISNLTITMCAKCY